LSDDYRKLSTKHVNKVEIEGECDVIIDNRTVITACFHVNTIMQL